MKGWLSRERYQLLDAPRIDALLWDELMEVWEERLKKAGLESPYAPARQFETLKQTTESKLEARKLIQMIEVRETGIVDTNNQHVKEMIIRNMTSKEAAGAFGGTPAKWRQRKGRALKVTPLTEDQIWTKAIESTFLKPDWVTTKKKLVNGLYALVKLPRQTPRVYFLLDEVVARNIEARQKASSSPSYALVRIFQAKTNVAQRVKKDAATAIAFGKADVRILTFGFKKTSED